MKEEEKGLTFVTDPEADVGVALVRGEEEVQEVGGADEELGNLSALVAADEGRGWKTPVVHLEDVIVHFRAEPGNRTEVDS